MLPLPLSEQQGFEYTHTVINVKGVLHAAMIDDMHVKNNSL